MVHDPIATSLPSSIAASSLSASSIGAEKSASVKSATRSELPGFRGARCSLSRNFSRSEQDAMTPNSRVHFSAMAPCHLRAVIDDDNFRPARGHTGGLQDSRKFSRVREEADSLRFARITSNGRSLDVVSRNSRCQIRPIIVLLERKDLPSSGAGETPLVAVAPALEQRNLRRHRCAAY